MAQGRASRSRRIGHRGDRRNGNIRRTEGLRQALSRRSGRPRRTGASCCRAWNAAGSHGHVCLGQPGTASVRIDASFADGRRSAAPDDFKGPLVEALAVALDRTSHPVVRARLAHLAWYQERKRRESGLAALNAYFEILERLDAGTLSAHDERTAVSIAGHEVLGLAFNVLRGLGHPEDRKRRLREITADFFHRACASGETWAVRRFGDVAIDQDALPPTEIGRAIEAFIAARTDPQPDFDAADLWQMAARAHHRARDEAEAHRCQAEMAESHVRLADHLEGSGAQASMVAHWVTEAIAAYHGHPAGKARRLELRHRLIDVQARIPDELSSFSHSSDIREIVEAARELFSGLGIAAALKRFTLLEGPPEPEILLEEARKSAAENPLSSLIPMSFMDADGKTVATSPGASIGPDGPEGSLEPQIMQAESIRRNFMVRAQIEIGRMTIAIEHRVSRNDLLRLLTASPSVPPRLRLTLAVGFEHYFDGDMIPALYILTPMLEGIIRHLLKSAGHDVTTLNDATRTQEDRTISSLYEGMRPEIDAILGPALAEDIRRVFLAKLGPGIRHGVAHALLPDGAAFAADASYACWLIWRLAVYPLLPVWDGVMEEEEPSNLQANDASSEVGSDPASSMV